jgi:hypothetical protein
LNRADAENVIHFGYRSCRTLEVTANYCNPQGEEVSKPGACAGFRGTYPSGIRKQLLVLRELIFAAAQASKGVGELEETLKWGEPAYVTAQSKSGSTVRIDWAPMALPHRVWLEGDSRKAKAECGQQRNVE